MIISKSGTTLTTHERHGIQLVPPLLGDLNGLCIIRLLLSIHALAVRVPDDILHVSILHSVCHIPEVLALGYSVLVTQLRHVRHEGLILAKNGPELLDA